MFIKKLNHFCGYAFYVVGVLRVIVVILALVLAGSAMVSVFSGDSNANVSYEGLAIIASVTAVVQLLLAMISIPMIFLNKKKEPEISSGYLYGLGAYLMEFVVPGFLMIYFVFLEASIYMKAGSKITKVTSNYFKTQDKKVNTDWFYNQANIDDIVLEKNENNIVNEMKKEKKNEKILEEIYEWRKLLDSGEIDEDSYNEMKEKLLKKMQK